MIGLDTNVSVRYLTQDDAKQSALASELIDGLTVADPGFVSLVAVVEPYWVLRSAYTTRLGSAVSSSSTHCSIPANFAWGTR